MNSLLPLLALLLPQDTHALAWSPPDGKVVVAKTTATAQGTDFQVSFDSEIELHPVKREGMKNAVSVQVQRLVLNEKMKEQARGFTFERGKELVMNGEFKEGELGSMAGSLAKDATAAVSRDGNFDSAKGESMALFVGLGLVERALPADPVGVGSTWSGKVQVPMPGPDFFGTLTYTLEAVEGGRTARVLLKVTEQSVISGEEKLKWHGGGTMVYSLTDRLITEFKFALERKNEEGKVVNSFKQEVAVSLKP